MFRMFWAGVWLQLFSVGLSDHVWQCLNTIEINRRMLFFFFFLENVLKWRSFSAVWKPDVCGVFLFLFFKYISLAGLVFLARGKAAQ